MPEILLTLMYFWSRKGFFLNQKQWDFLVELFKQEFCRLYGMTSRAVAEIYSTGQGYSPENSTTVMKMIAPRKDPAVTGELQEVGTCTLPFSKQQPLKDCLLHKLKNYMDTENPPHKSCLKALFTALRFNFCMWYKGYLLKKIACTSLALEEMAKRNDG
ncbi:hypothetical protein NC651_019710 [Populus alba x Populus x berolinensis]|nr:hypothetical protein NC651_019710 [Populus alba x Populus x berolinensis]